MEHTDEVTAQQTNRTLFHVACLRAGKVASMDAADYDAAVQLVRQRRYRNLLSLRDADVRRIATYFAPARLVVRAPQRREFRSRGSRRRGTRARSPGRPSSDDADPHQLAARAA
jgi:hypothetical protein